MSWQLQVLGHASLSQGSTTLHLERKTMAVLTYLALEGPTHRSKLAGLLWPDSDEKTARNNLAQVLRRLKKITEATLILGEGEDILSLSGELTADVAKLKVLVFAGDSGFLNLGGELLLTYDYDDCPDFADWLFSERERLHVSRQNALVALTQQHEKQGNYPEALRCAETLLQLDALSEEAHRLGMRLHFLVGDKAAALKAFERCKEILAKELGVEPSSETRSLAAEIEFGSLLPVATKIKSELPLHVLRPPLVGREDLWLRMDEAQDKSQAIILRGEPGVGKSRLLKDFLDSKGAYTLFEGRPGDSGVPYSTGSRMLRQVLTLYPLTLEPWQRKELSRLLPELGDTPEPLTSETEQLRFYEAQAAVFQHAFEKGMHAIAVDDLQFFDDASFKSLHFILAKHWGKPNTLQIVLSYRRNELSADSETLLKDTVQAGSSILLDISPLDEAQVQTLVNSLGIANLEPLQKTLHSYTGGNPLFMLETIKSVLESDSKMLKLPSSSKVQTLLQQRLNKLSQPALRLAWTAAIAQTDFSLELASHITQQSPFDLAEPLTELEQRSIFTGQRFSHDLIFETALASISSPVKIYLHKQTAEFLEKQQVNPASIANHYLEAGLEAKATPFLLEAARQQRATFRYIEAVQFFDSAIHVLEKQGETEAVFETLYEQGKIIGGVDLSEKREKIVQKLFSLAHSLEQQAKACEYAARYYLDKGDVAQLERVSQQGYDYALTTENLVLQLFFSKMFARVHWQRHQMQQGIDLLKPALQLAKNHQLEYEIADISYTIGMMLSDINPSDEADEYFREAQAIFEKQGNIPELVGVISYRTLAKSILGLLPDALELNYQALELLDKTSGSLDIRMSLEINRATYLRNLEEYAQSLDIMLRLQRSTLADYGQSVFLNREFALLYLCLGEIEKGRELLQQALNSAFSHLPQHYLTTQYYYIYFLAATNNYNGELETLEQPDRETLTYMLWLALDAKANKNLKVAEEWLSITRNKKLHAGEIHALCRCAALSLERHPTKALEYTTEMLRLMETYGTGVYTGELLLTHYQALKACKDKTAKDYLRQTLAWLMDIADNHVPPEHRESFLSNNLINKAILEAARLEGLVSKTSV